MPKSISIVSPSLKMGGIERALVVLAEYFAECGHHVNFISCLSGPHFYKLTSGINLIELKFKHSERPLCKFIFYIRVIFSLRRTIIKNIPDVVLVFGDWFSPLVLFSLLGLTIPVFISDRTSPDYRFKFPLPLFKKWLYPRSAGFIAQTKRAAEFKHKQFGNKLNIAVIPNALREVSLYPDIKREKIILYVGRFAWEKGPDRLIRAYASLINPEKWKLIMAGSGPLLKPMKELAIQLNKKESIIFTGKVEDVDQLYSIAGIYVLPSVLEGFPNSLCEAMAAGLPVICYDSIAWEEILEDGISGIVVKGNENTGLTNALQKLICDERLRHKLGNNAVSIRERLKVEKIGKQVEEFIFSQ